MATEEVIELSGLPPYTAMLSSQFQACPRLLYNLFDPTVGDGDLDVNHHSDKVLDMRGDRIHREFKVKNVEELHNLTKALLNKPMLFDTELAYQRTEQLMDCNIGARLTGFFVVLVNTTDPRIRQLLTHRLVQAMQYMQEGKNFCLKLNFGASMKQWFSENVDREEAGCLTSRYNTDYGSMTIWVTNCSTPSTEFCGTMLCLCYLFCPPSLLIGVPCCLAHKLYRKVTCIDKKQDFSNLPITLLRTRTHTVSNRIRCALPNPSAPQRRTQPLSGQRQGHPRQGHPSRKRSELLSNDELDQTL